MDWLAISSLVHNPPFRPLRVYKSTTRYNVGDLYMQYSDEPWSESVNNRHHLTELTGGWNEAGNYLPFTARFWLNLRLWMRRARRSARLRVSYRER